MTDENTIIENGTPENQEPEESKPEKKKSSLMKYIIFAVSGLVVVAGIAFGVSMFLGGSDTADHAEQTATEEHQSEQPETTDHATINMHDEPAGETTTSHEPEVSDEIEAMAEAEQDIFEPSKIDVDIPAEEFDESAIDKIMANLEFLDYQPEESEMQQESEGMSVEDSVEQVNWLEAEKKKLTDREQQIKKREQELVKLEREVNAKINRLDQAESSRIGKLAKLYDSMESRAVAKLMMNLDDETVVSILPKMKNKNAAAVLQLMPSQRAARLSKQLITIAGN